MVICCEQLPILEVGGTKSFHIKLERKRYRNCGIGFGKSPTNLPMMYDTCRYDVSIHLEQAGARLEDVTATTGIHVHHGEITRQTGSFYDK